MHNIRQQFIVVETRILGDLNDQRRLSPQIHIQNNGIPILYTAPALDMAVNFVVKEGNGRALIIIPVFDVFPAASYAENFR